MSLDFPFSASALTQFSRQLIRSPVLDRRPGPGALSLFSAHQWPPWRDCRPVSTPQWSVPEPALFCDVANPRRPASLGSTLERVAPPSWPLDHRTLFYVRRCPKPALPAPFQRFDATSAASSSSPGCRHAKTMSGAPEWFASLESGIRATLSEVLQCGVIEIEELTTLARALLPIQQGRHDIAHCSAGNGP